MKEDVLNGFMQETIDLDDDYEGKVSAVLVSKKAKSETNKAVLYIHGFADYFFNDILADVYNIEGYDFYALDLRKYGRSLMGHQSPNLCLDMSEYFEEIDKAISIIRDRDNHSMVILNGHSTGGLTTSLYAHERRNTNLIDGLILNSPWFDMNEDWLTKNVFIKMAYAVGKLSPNTIAPKGVDPNYPKSIHKNHLIEEKEQIGVYESDRWNFNTEWKSVGAFPVYNGFLRSVRLGQKKIHKGLDIKCPIFMLCSDKKGKRSRKIKPYYFNSDCVLNPEHMTKYISNIGNNIKQVIIKDGMHDLALSTREVRENYFDEIRTWLNETF